MIHYAKDPESHLADDYIDTGNIQASGAHLFGAELAGVVGPFSAQAEFAGSLVDTVASGNEFFWGVYVQGSYMLTGEHRNYSFQKGVFTRLKPTKNFAPGRGDWGAFELAARFTKLDFDSGTVQAGEIYNILGGVNWYLTPHFRMMANYIYSKLEDDGFGNIYQMRFQVDF